MTTRAKSKRGVAMSNAMRAAMARAAQPDAAAGLEFYTAAIGSTLDPRRYSVHVTVARRDGRPLSREDIASIEAAHPGATARKRAVAKRAAARVGRAKR